jgi:hypothetical protein
LAEIEQTAENLSIALAGISLKARKAIERVSILAGQLEKVFLSLVIVKKEEAAKILRIRYIIYRLIIPKIQNERT